MLKFYLSPGGLTCFEYSRLCEEVSALGWKLTFSWPVKSFSPEFKPTPALIEKSVAGIGGAELFIAVLPGNSNTLVELGLAYVWCQEIALCTQNAAYFAPAHPSCIHQALLPGITHFIGKPSELPALLKHYYLYLVAN